MMITNLGFLARIFMVCHIKLTNQRLCNGLYLDVILGKISLGSQSTWGVRLIERLMTVAVTLQQRSKNIFLFLTTLPNHAL